MIDPLVHPRKEIGYVTMFNHHPFGDTGRTGCVNQIGQIIRPDTAVGIADRGRRNPRIRINLQHRSLVGRQAVNQTGLAQNNRCLTVGDHM